MKSSPAVLEVSDLTILNLVDQKILLNKVALTVHASETLCIIGESGSGKSLTALSILGLLPDSLSIVQGSIVLEEKNLLDLSEIGWQNIRPTKMAAVFQDALNAWNPLQTIGTQIEEVLRLHTLQNKSERKQSVLQILEQVELHPAKKFYDAYPHTLSGGQRQRALIAMAIILKPRILIADEPTSALDVCTQTDILRLLKKLKTELAMGMVFITHDHSIVRHFADHVLTLRAGKIIQSETADAYQQRVAVPEKLSELFSKKKPPEVLSPPLLNVRNVCHSYQKKQWFRNKTHSLTLNHINFTLQSGETLAIIGESGSGKSTLARCLVQLVTPDSGTIEYKGLPHTKSLRQNAQRAKQKIQMIFQDPFSSLNPYQNIQTTVLEGVPNSVQNSNLACELLEMVGLPNTLLLKYPHQLSGGQCQRVAIARALAVQPEILIADEAVSALDERNAEHILELLQHLCEKNNMSLILISHDLRAAAKWCQSIVVLSSGTIVESGSTETILSNPAHEYTQKLTKSLSLFT